MDEKIGFITGLLIIICVYTGIVTWKLEDIKKEIKDLYVSKQKSSNSIEYYLRKIEYYLRQMNARRF